MAARLPATLERPVYGMSQAARLLGLRTDGLRRWIDGYERAGVTYAPVIREERTGTDTVTWGEFVEAGYLREYRARSVTLQYLRPVIALLRKELGVRYPLATLKPYTSGRQLALEVQRTVGLDPALNLVILGRDGTLQLADPAQAFVRRSTSPTAATVTRSGSIPWAAPSRSSSIPSAASANPPCLEASAPRPSPNSSPPANRPSTWRLCTASTSTRSTPPSTTRLRPDSSPLPDTHTCPQRPVHRAGFSTRTVSASRSPFNTSAATSPGPAHPTASFPPALLTSRGCRSSDPPDSWY